MAAELIFEIIALAQRVPEFISAIQELAKKGEDPSPEFIQQWKDKLADSMAERNDLIAQAKARLGV